MPEASPAAGSSLGSTIKKRWRGWLRAIHRDFGYLAVGFTIIYALSGIAINHISDWDPNFTSSERSLVIAPIPPELPDDEAVKRVLAAAGTGTPDDVYRAGDEIRLSYSGGSQVTVIGEQVTVQQRSERFFFRVANWLHYNRGKKAWTILADIYAVMLLYLAISGIFMIKGKLGIKWRGTILIGLGVAVPVAYVVMSGGPSKNATKNATTSAPSTASTPAPTPNLPDEAPQVGSASPDDGFAMKPRPPVGSNAGSSAGSGSSEPVDEPGGDLPKTLPF
ncbi:MAG: PepSY-associated TM helix domain-containing protein [Kofleriaceae bacterium]